MVEEAPNLDTPVLEALDENGEPLFKPDKKER